MSAAPTQDNATRTGIIARAVIYTLLLIFAVYYLLPLYVMVVNSLKPLEEIRQVFPPSPDMAGESVVVLEPPLACVPPFMTTR